MPAARTLLLLMVPFATSLNAIALGPLLPYVGEDLPTTGTIEGALVATSGGTYVIGALLIGPLVRRFTARRTIFAGLLLFALVSLMHWFAGSIPLLFGVRAAVGGAAALVHLGLQTAVPQLDPKLGRAMGFWNVGVFLCMPIGVPLALQLARWSWRGGFVLVGVIALLALALLTRIRWQEPKAGPKATRGPHEAALVVSTAAVSGALFAFFQFMGKWLDGDGILPADRQSWIWLGLSALAVLSSGGVSKVGDRLGLDRIALFAVCVILCLFLTAFFVRDLVAVVALGIPLALAVGAQASALDALVVGFAQDDRRPDLVGARSAAGALAGALAAAVGGALFDAMGFSGLLGLLVAMLGLALVVLPRWLGRGAAR